jgi:methyltransferase (TIGR00027 family)
MKPANRSKTAEIPAIMRALHQTIDEEPRILDDSIVPRLIDTTRRDEDWLAQFVNHRFAKRWRAGFVMRSRYAEDCLAEGAARGVRQYVILGAGLDTFAYRKPRWASSLRIYEVDHPETQRWKRGKLAAAGIAIPPNLTFVPIDFETTTLTDALWATGFASATESLCSWLGVTQYLSSDTIDTTLRFVLSLPHLSEIVLSFILPQEALAGVEAEAVQTAALRAAEVGEPWLSRFYAGNLEAKLRALGFSSVIHLTPEDAHERYFRNRRDGLEPRRGEQLMRAIV